MHSTTEPVGPRPAGFPTTAVWPPRVRTSGPVTATADSVLRLGTVPEGGVGVQVGGGSAPPPVRPAVPSAPPIAPEVVTPPRAVVKKGRR